MQSQSMNSDNGNGNGAHGHNRKASSTSITGIVTPAAQVVRQRHSSTPREIAAAALATPAAANAAPTTAAEGSALPGAAAGKVDSRPGSVVGGASASPSLKNLLH